MNTAEIIADIRQGIRAPSTAKVKDSKITSTILKGVSVLGLHLLDHAPKTLEKRVSLSSNHNVFDFPGDCKTVNHVWDLGVNAGTVTGATAANPVVITEAAHGRATDDIVTIHDVGGVTSANGTFEITKVDADSYSLDDCDGSRDEAYISGGKVFKEDTEFSLIHRMPESEISMDDETHWFLRNKQIVIDDVTFAYDILVKYLQEVTEVKDIPVEYHPGLVAFGVIDLIRVPPRDEDPRFYDYQRSLNWQKDIWALTVSSITGGARQSTESLNLNKVKRIANLRI